MRLLQAEGDDLVLVDMNEDSAPYAILSHRWLAAKEEVLFRDIDNKVSKEMLKAKEGWKKLQWCREQAARDGYQYVWADTACIDKSSSQELTESINSMYRWYQKAGVCYVYLNDMPDGLERNEAPSIGVRDEVVQTSTFAESNRPFTEPSVQYQLKIEDSSASGGLPQVLTLALPQQAHCNPKYGEPRDLDRHDLESQLRKSCANGENPMRATISGLESTTWEEWDRVAFGESQWFTRAWTLQEMIASKEVRFYSQSWQLIGRLTELAKDVTAITGVHEEVLMDNSTVNSYSIAQRMSWAAYRESTKVEDRAVSLS